MHSARFVILWDPTESSANAIVLCVDEKSQIQALERTQPMLPIGLGYAGVTHDFERHATTNLFATQDLTNDEVLPNTSVDTDIGSTWHS